MLLSVMQTRETPQRWLGGDEADEAALDVGAAWEGGSLTSSPNTSGGRNASGCLSVLALRVRGIRC